MMRPSDHIRCILILGLLLVQPLGCQARESSAPETGTKAPASTPASDRDTGAGGARSIVMPVFSGVVRDLVSHLRKESGIPLSFIEADATATLALPAGDYALDDLLGKVEIATSQYRHEHVRGRLVLLPKDPRYDTIVGKVEINQAKRPEAADRYFELLRSKVPGFEDYSGAIVFGYASSPVYSERVSLSAEAPVLHHLVEMLGDNSRVIFTVFKTKGKHAIQFGMVRDGIQIGG